MSYKEEIEAALAQLRETAGTQLAEVRGDPEKLRAFLSFKARHMEFGVNNSLLLMKEMPDMVFAASYERWRDIGYSVRRGEEGVKIITPRKVRCFLRDDKYVEVAKATLEEMRALATGRLAVRTFTNYTVGRVFDAAQTNCSKTDQALLFENPYPQRHEQLACALCACLGDEGRGEQIPALAVRCAEAYFGGNASPLELTFEKECARQIFCERFGIEPDRAALARLLGAFSELRADAEFDLGAALESVTRACRRVDANVYDEMLSVRRRERKRERDVPQH